MEPKDIRSEMEGQPPETQLGIGMVLILLRVWYGQANENPERAGIILRQAMQLSKDEIVIGAKAYLHLTYGDNLSFPEQQREFLRRSPELVVPILRAVLGDKISLDFDGGSGRITPQKMRMVINGFTLLALLPKETQAAFRTEIDKLYERMPFTVIDADTLAEARQLIETGGITTRHPAYIFVTRLIQTAPDTQTLPARAAELFALVTGPSPQE